MDDASLRKLCSDVTLQSQKDGFFNQWADQVENMITNEFLVKFSQLKSDKERFEMTWKQECVHTLQIQKCYSQKNLKVCEEKRIEGNKAFQENDNQKALLLYSQAIIRAPSENEVLSLCYANRSAALFHCKKYKLCLQDIALAISNAYPNRLKYKILERRGQCLGKLDRIKEAESSFEEAISAVQKSDMNDAKKEAWVRDTLRKRSEATTTIPREETDNEEHLEGRYMVASENIPAVKALLRELPFSSVLMQEKRGVFCEHCFEKIIAPLPCNTCSGVAFCSPECQSIGLNSYHKWECHYLNLFKASGMSLNCFLTLRVVTERGLQFFKMNCPHDMESTEIPSKKSPHNPDSFKTFFNLVGLEGQRDPRDFFRRTLMAVFLLKVLQHSSFFGKDPSGEENDVQEDLFLIGAILLRSLQVIQFNAHEVSGISFQEKRSFSTCKSVYLGLAVYPTVSFFNHSCYPAVGRYFNGKEMTIVNLRPLKAGEMVAENYGPIFTHSSRDQRRRKLFSRYWFMCKCEACEGDWPMYNNMPNKITFIEPLVTKQNKGKSKRKKNKNKSQSNDVISGASSSDVTSGVSVAGQPDFNTDEKDEYLSIIQKHFDKGKSLMDEFKREDAIAQYKLYVECLVHKADLPIKDLHLSLESLRLLVGSRGSSYVVRK